MLRLLLSHSMFRIQYSDGIRPSLLATLSLSVNIGGSNHYQLIHSLQKNNIVQCSFVLEALHSLDRQSFTSVPFPYKNIPYRIHSDENMTDILTHAIILQHLSPFLCRNFLNILDIGTGHGYLAFAMAKILLFKGYTHFRITGLDSSLQSVTECQRLNEIFVCG